MAQMVAESEGDEIWEIKPASIRAVGLESRFAVDDLSLEGRGLNALAQAKEGLSLEKGPKSPLAAAMDQVVRAHLDPSVPNDTEFVIVAGPGSTLPITKDLARVCSRFRGGLPARGRDRLRTSGMAGLES